MQHCVSWAMAQMHFILLLKLLLLSQDLVIVPALTWISTSESVTQAGGTPVFADIDPISYCIDPSSVASKLTQNTVGIIPVHLYGHMADMDSLLGLCRTHGLWIIEDCAQAHLAEYRNKKAGTFGALSTFSFYPGKNLGAMGDAGCILTDDSALAHYCTKYARHGGVIKGQHDIEGINSRLDGIQAAILNVKMKHLSAWTRSRREHADYYSHALSQIPTITCPVVGKDFLHAWHLYAIQVDDRDDLKCYLSENGIASSINYYPALPFVPAYKHKKHQKNDFPVAESLSRKTLSLPIYPELGEEKQRYIVEKLQDFYCQ